MAKKILDIPKFVEQAEAPRTWTSWIDCMYMPLFAEGDERSTHELMGLSGFAFRLQMENETICSSSPFTFDWQNVFAESMLRLGYKSRFYYGRFEGAFLPHVSERFPLVTSNREAIEVVQQHIDSGKPVIAFDLFLPEFGVIYGYDDDAQVLYAMDVARPEGAPFSYAKLGHTYSSILCVGGIAEREEIHEDEALRQALAFAVNHARGRDTYAADSYTSGLTAYDVWIEHMSKGPKTIEPSILACISAVYADARENAALFLRDVRCPEQVKPFLEIAAEAYGRVHGELKQLCERYPFPHGGKPAVENLRESIENLQYAKEAEEKAVRHLEKALELFPV
ncbi:MAG: hypothetical protein H0Z34_03360 [Brevibacillus sp.]|nr:hypothetical protein [Brevibacillus sp.]